MQRRGAMRARACPQLKHRGYCANHFLLHYAGAYNWHHLCKRSFNFVKDQQMNARSLTDFLVAGMAVVPAALAAMGEIGPAIMAFVPLLIAACLCGMHEQATDRDQSGVD